MTSCSRCSLPNDRAPQRYCSSCHAAYMRDWRETRDDMFEVLYELTWWAKRQGKAVAAAASEVVCDLLLMLDGRDVSDKLLLDVEILRLTARTNVKNCNKGALLTCP